MGKERGSCAQGPLITSVGACLCVLLGVLGGMQDSALGRSPVCVCEYVRVCIRGCTVLQHPQPTLYVCVCVCVSVCALGGVLCYNILNQLCMCACVCVCVCPTGVNEWMLPLLALSLHTCVCPLRTEPSMCWHLQERVSVHSAVPCPADSLLVPRACAPLGPRPACPPV